MYAVWSNTGEGVRWLSAASASIEDASTAQTLAAGRKLRRDTCIAPTSLQWRPVESEPVYPPILPGSIDRGGLVDNGAVSELITLCGSRMSSTAKYREKMLSSAVMLFCAMVTIRSSLARRAQKTS